MEKRQTLIINLLGGPGAGKSTLATLIFSKLKIHQIKCELTTEFAKEIVWENRMKLLQNQLCVFSEQFARIWKIEDFVDVIVTDSPILLSIYYNNAQNSHNRFEQTEFTNLVISCYNIYNNLNYFIRRHHKYEAVGRYQTEEESSQIESDMLNLYKNLNIPYKEVFSSEQYADEIVADVIKEVNKIKGERYELSSKAQH